MGAELQQVAGRDFFGAEYYCVHAVALQVPVLGGLLFTQAAGGVYHTCLLDGGGAAYCFGKGEGVSGCVPCCSTAPHCHVSTYP